MRFVLVTGAEGQLGRELQRCVLPEGWQVIGRDRAALDLGDSDALAAVVAAGHLGSPWAAVINAAAYTAVDKAETEQVEAWRINALAPAALARACAAAGLPLVHVSTDYVFSGAQSVARTVADPVDPLSVYGASKLGGELAVRTSGARYAIVRTAWVISAHGNNFVKTMLRLAADRDTVRVVADQQGSPTGAADLAHALITVMSALAGDPAAPGGTFHFSNSGVTNWANFAAEIFRQSRARGGAYARVIPITTAEYPTPVVRPANSLLDTSAITAAYGLAPRPWQEALGEILDEMIGPAT